MNTQIQTIKWQVRVMLLVFIVLLVLSGATAIPVISGLSFLLQTLPEGNAVYSLLEKVYAGALDTSNKYPFLFYGYDWLAFAHFVIAVAFLGPYRNPVRNIWVIEFGMVACVMVIPFALVFSKYRGLPFWWSLIDCSFGLFGILPLWYCHTKIKLLEKLQAEDRLNTIL
jgi:hypothetical protein